MKAVGMAGKYQAVGLFTLDPQPWQNRPTFQQVVQVKGQASR